MAKLSSRLLETWKDLILNFTYLLIDGSDVLVRICKLESFRTSYNWSYVYRTDIAFLRKSYFIRQTRMLKPVNELSFRVLMQLNELTRCLPYLVTVSTGKRQYRISSRRYLGWPFIVSGTDLQTKASVLFWFSYFVCLLNRESSIDH